jgi:hypothetical protein
MEIIVDFKTGEVQGQKHMDYIDAIFDNMNKADAKEAMKELVRLMLDTRAEDREIIQEYDSLLEETHKALMEAIDLLNKK